jgi:hypothetical protein
MIFWNKKGNEHISACMKAGKPGILGINLHRSMAYRSDTEDNFPPHSAEN